MMYIEEFRVATSNRFSSMFTPSYPATLIQWVNLPFEQPDGDHFVSMEFNDAFGSAAEIGTGVRVERYTGVLRIKIHSPQDQGSKTLNEMSQVASRIFVRQTLAGVNWSARFTRGMRINNTTAGEWNVRVIDLAYERDERNSD